MTLDCCRDSADLVTDAAQALLAFSFVADAGSRRELIAGFDERSCADHPRWAQYIVRTGREARVVSSVQGHTEQAAGFVQRLHETLDLRREILGRAIGEIAEQLCVDPGRGQRGD